jgi:hypothetical protein
MGNEIEKLIEGELNRIPDQIKPFLHKADADVEAKTFMTLGLMAYAYGRAFEELAESALMQWPKKDFIIQPMVYLARHSMDVHLKKTIKDYQGHPDDRTPIDHHSLMKLWNLLTKSLSDAGYVKDDEYAGYRYDPKAERSRRSRRLRTI